MKVSIRHRKSSSGEKINLSLIVYKGYVKNGDGINKIMRESIALEYFLYANPRNPVEKTHNKDTERKVEIIRAEREKDYLNGKYGFKSETKTKVNFIEYFEKLTNERYQSKGNYGNWDSVLKHLIGYKGKNVSFERIDIEYCEGFKEYLTNVAKKSDRKPLSSSSISSYFNKMRAALNQAVDDGILLVNPSLKVSTPRIIEKEREFLTELEVQALINAECRYDVLKRAFLYSCMTGLRWSDIQKLEWSQLQKVDGEWRITFHQQKTKGLQYQPINQQAVDLMGIKTDETERVFIGLNYSDYMNVALLQWCLKAGITKHITFHCARHTYATLLLTNNTDLFVVSKLMGHSEIRTTQIYAKVIDKKKNEAVNNLPKFEM